VSESLFEAQRLADTFQILIHEFPWDGQIWAVILGTRDDPEEYSIWGKVDDNTRQISYHNRSCSKRSCLRSYTRALVDISLMLATVMVSHRPRQQAHEDID
jgi:hypothetical protein